MSASTTATTSSTSTRGFWEGLWRMSGINFVVFAIIAWVIYGNPPQVGAPADALVAFYDGHRTRILIAAAFSGLNVLNLMWFAAALRTTLADAGQDGWGTAATASSAAVGGLFLVLLTVSAALAYSIAGSGNQTLTAGLNDFVWALVALSSFPRAMRSEEHTSELQSRLHLVCRLLLEKKKKNSTPHRLSTHNDRPT